MNISSETKEIVENFSIELESLSAFQIKKLEVLEEELKRTSGIAGFFSGLVFFCWIIGVFAIFRAHFITTLFMGITGGLFMFISFKIHANKKKKAIGEIIFKE